MRVAIDSALGRREKLTQERNQFLHRHQVAPPLVNRELVERGLARELGQPGPGQRVRAFGLLAVVGDDAADRRLSLIDAVGVPGNNRTRRAAGADDRLSRSGWPVLRM